MNDLTKEVIEFLYKKTEIRLKELIGHLNATEIKKRCCCIVAGSTHEYCLDNKSILKVDFRPRVMI